MGKRREDYQREWQEKNRDKMKGYKQTWKIKHPNGWKLYSQARRKKWDIWLKFFGYDRCDRCGYHSCLRAIEFHHKDSKKFDIGTFMSRHPCNDTTQQIVREEILKCQILCANCHREQHYDS